MIYFLCMMFDRSKVDDINWLEIRSVGSVSNFAGKSSFTKWRDIWINASPGSMMLEYIRLTNLAFRCDLKCLPVFLLDEVQALCDPPDQSVRASLPNNLRLLAMLKSLVGPSGYPVCVCTGTNSGNIFTLEETSSILPISIGIGPLSEPKDYFLNWDEMSSYVKSINPAAQSLDRSADHDIVMCLIHGSYKIPRLLAVAHRIWSKTRISGHSENLVAQRFEFEEMRGVWNIRRLSWLI